MNYSRNMELRLYVGYVTVKLIYTNIRKLKITKLMKKEFTRDNKKCTAKIQINGIRLNLRAD
jgi:hypothetical protein